MKEGKYTGTYQRNEEHDVEKKECESRNPDVLGGKEFLLRGWPKSLYPPHPKGEQHETAPHWSTGPWEPPGVYCGPGSTLPLTEGLCAPRPARRKGLEQHFCSWRRCAESECGEASLWHARCEERNSILSRDWSDPLQGGEATPLLLLYLATVGGVKLSHTHGTGLQLTFQVGSIPRLHKPLGVMGKVCW